MTVDRRRFLQASGLAGAGALLGARPSAAVPQRTRKLLIVVFGGGTRSSEAIDDPQHHFIPQLWGELVPRGTLFRNLRVERTVVHPNSTGSLLTGHWEWEDLDWSRPVEHPTVFETLRQAQSAPDTSAWAFVYASILAQVGASRAPGYGIRHAANVVEPPTIPRRTAEDMDRLMRHAAALGSVEAEREAATEAARLARTTSRIALGGLRSEEARSFVQGEYEAWRQGTETTSHDAFLADRAIACMGTFGPDVLLVAFGEIDCAHYGSWSRYVEAIRRTDALTWRLWRALQELQAYRDQTLMLVLPDHGRELERPGGPGFLHHSDFYTGQGADEGCRRIWMLAVGPGVAAGRAIDRPTPLTAAAATGLEYLGLEAPRGAEPSVLAQTA
jgi:hypothetical protein